MIQISTCNLYIVCNISKTSARVSPGVPNTKKQMKARGHRPSAFIATVVFSVTPFKIDQNENQNRSIDKIQNLENERR